VKCVKTAEPNKVPGHSRSAVDVLKATQQGAEPVRCSWDVPDEDAHCRTLKGIQLNYPCAAAMRPCVNAIMFVSHCRQL